ncbi:MAG: ribosome-associated translation inhibitor RaiA [Lachnospiraceae bacterium]|nr:ribosome-associated translation inhibitor RaiA [Lachnospiraceae bacterium]MBQ9593576.1 ribosome-associated translation inhibitor RaiA [Lachnospiraceae bacterium]MBR0152481.1 ribosome-associated translation inhibitor RaiA [Lachnospiraceae bacterium]
MKYTIVGKNMEVHERLSNQVMKKLDKLDKYFADDVEAQVTLSTVKDSKKVEVTIPTKGQLIRAEQTTGDMYASIDAVEEIIERQLRKYKTRMLSKKKGAKDAFNEAFLDAEPEVSEDIKITRVKRFAVKPMDPEEACLQMELLGHNFFLFQDAESEGISVVYKRNDGTYGLIEAE